MYLNAEAWFGTPMYDKAEKACKDIMDIGAYSIEDSYSTNFDGSSSILVVKNAYLWLKYLIISTLISIIKVADVRIF